MKEHVSAVRSVHLVRIVLGTQLMFEINAFRASSSFEPYYASLCLPVKRPGGIAELMMKQFLLFAVLPTLLAEEYWTPPQCRPHKLSRLVLRELSLNGRDMVLTVQLLCLVKWADFLLFKPLKDIRPFYVLNASFPVGTKVGSLAKVMAEAIQRQKVSSERTYYAQAFLKLGGVS
ncbi:unnamed protein product [Cylicostephanus goldi]|uniref:Uncharacterized protein n=1 Tax=Cylicostephanus goldi TaxID=71465 RepID=A0A3P6QKK4_CYLGO|nr:unnamed protein product [Cylicostephanus goldi]